MACKGCCTEWAEGLPFLRAIRDADESPGKVANKSLISLLLLCQLKRCTINISASFEQQPSHEQVSSSSSIRQGRSKEVAGSVDELYLG